MLKLVTILALPYLAFADYAASGTQILSFNIVSDTNTWVLGPSKPTGGFAVQVSSPPSAWTASIPGAIWIWDNESVTKPTNDQLCFFFKEFSIQGQPVSGIYQIASDNSGWTTINGQPSNCDSAGFVNTGQRSCNVTSLLKSGINAIQVTVLNAGQIGGNPAGLLFKLTVMHKL